MKIGIISDTHDDFEAVRKVIKILEEKGCKALLHCGDFCAPFMIKELAAFSGEVHAVFGNTDDRFLSTKVAQENNVKLYGETAIFDLAGNKIAINHYPNLARGLALSKDFDAVFYGHNHIKQAEKIGNTWLINPGELKGYKHPPSYAIYDTEKDSVELIDFI